MTSANDDSFCYNLLRLGLLSTILLFISFFLLHCEKLENSDSRNLDQSLSTDSMSKQLAANQEADLQQIEIGVLPNDHETDFQDENVIENDRDQEPTPDEDLNDLLRPLDESKEKLDTDINSSDPSETNLIESFSNLSEQERQLCAKLLSVPSEKIKFIENLERFKIDSRDGLAIKMSSISPDVEINLANISIDRPGYLAGVCVFAKSDDTKIVVNIDTHINRIVHIARKDNVDGKYVITQNGVAGLIIGDLAGNNTELALTGEGAFACGTALMKFGSQTSEFHCP